MNPCTKADLYFQDRKMFIKTLLQGERDNAMKLLEKNNDFYKENYRLDPDTFHSAHHKYLNWYSDYQCFERHRSLIINARMDLNRLIYDAKLLDHVDESINSYLESGDKQELYNLLDELYEKKESNYKESLDLCDTILTIEDQIKEDETYEQHNYFQDVDPLGFKDLNPRKYFDFMCNISSNNGPVKFED